MGRIGLAFRMFFRILFHGDFAVRAGELIDGAVAPAGPTLAPVALRAEMKAAAQSEALTLLGVLQREGRLVDFLKEPIGAYDDVQIGAAVRDVHRDCSAAVERVFGLRAILNEAEGASINVPAGFDAARIRLIGNVAGQPPYTGRLQHHGWEATQVQLPEWSGTGKAANVVAPAEVEIG